MPTPRSPFTNKPKPSTRKCNNFQQAGQCGTPEHPTAGLAGRELDRKSIQSHLPLIAFKLFLKFPGLAPAATGSTSENRPRCSGASSRWAASPLRTPRLVPSVHIEIHSATTGNPEVMTPSEVKSPPSIDRFLVVFHSPTGMAETGLPIPRPEKMKAIGAWGRWPGHSLRSGSRRENRELAGI
jgi:hypothetical protein